MKRTPHLGANVRAYVDGALDERTLMGFDRHLVACMVCFDAVQRERQLVSSLRKGSTPQVSAGLESLLLGLCSTAPETPADGPAPGLATVPTTPRGLPPMPMMRLATVAPSAPAQHHSPRRAAFLATVAAGATAAAAWSLATVAPSATPTPLRIPSPAGTTTFGTGLSVSMFQGAEARLTVRTARHWAESTP